MKLLVVGAGEMGRWFGEVAATELGADSDSEADVDSDSDLGPDSDGVDLAFADRDPAVAEAAAREVGGRAVPTATDERFDAVCIAVPISAANEAIERHAPRAERALLDVTGQMADPVEAMAAAAPDRERASLHPLFAAANAPGNVAVVTDESGPVTDRLFDALEAAGNRLVETTPAEHDEAMETVQAGTHAAVLAFALAADDVPEGLTTPVFEALRDVAEQVTGNAPSVYAEIQATFGGAEAVAEAAARLAEADDEAFEDLYREASESARGELRENAGRETNDDAEGDDR
ncbi:MULTISPECIES: prephenate dehydrogenase/arogenate dehydrogenase family protein [Halorussus]|uniref:prephenate dehydrogenase/arogenate dehydrogenase family protein n=1 Tax=Halorussus TaxID=1070314 RepID=UPI000E2171B2|nr:MULTISPECIES: prephenate dehydrogenase/arogenate dehydrogenase family protein [Halorussus]NHN59221.1 prephenate dehydrogenase [Halorussus sp. JP-T4]